jgi:hypothetical protein
MKTCNKCKVEKEDTAFYKRKDKLQSRCKVCQRQDRHKYYKPHSTIRLQLGLTQEEVDETVAVGKCESCGRTDRRLCIDHNHKTNKVRGLLCHNCNTVLGLVGDNVSELSNLITYLNDRNYCNSEAAITVGQLSQLGDQH